MSQTEDKNIPSKQSKKVRPECDLTSESFDPMIALYSEGIHVPIQNPKIYDNVNMFETMLNNTRSNSSKPSTKPGIVQTTLPGPSVRRFLPHQGPVKGTGPKSRHKRNVLKMMDDGFKGPMARLEFYMKEKKRIKITTRKKDTILGYITGFIESFDKHWNIALSNVTEVWKRRKTHLCDVANFGPTEDCSRQLKRLNINIPAVQVKSLNRKYVECCRKIPQLLIRGEQIVFISLDKI